MVRSRESIKLNKTNVVNDVVEFFHESREDFINKNESFLNVWKFAPGSKAKYWEEFYSEKIMAIGWDNHDLGDLTKYQTSEELAEKLGVDNPKMSNEIWNLESFRDSNNGDIVVATKGRSGVVGVGVIKGTYEYRKKRSYYKHVRKVDWLIKTDMAFDKSLFRADTFSPTLKWAVIKDRLIESDSKYEPIVAGLETGKIIEEDNQQRVQEEVEQNYWWLNANPKQWKIDDYRIGDAIRYTIFNEKGNKRRVFDYFFQVKPGDPVFGYQSTPVRKIISMLEVSRPVFQDENGDQVIELFVKEFFSNPIDFSEIESDSELESCEIIKNRQGSLYKLTEQEFEEIQNTIANANPKPIQPEYYQTLEPFTLEQAVAASGLSKDRFEEILKILKESRQIVIQGPPGTGKSYLAKILRDYFTERDPERSETIQFHPSYSYEDFVEGYRPTEKGGLDLKDGIFKKICHRSRVSKKPTVLIIDEINRGDLSKIFGELLYLLKYRKERIKLTYSPDLPFDIPDNLFIIGTMNTADRSLALMDYALRRRFRFIYLSPDYEVIKTYIETSEFDIDQLISNIKEINSVIAENASLGKDFQIGHSYFIRDKQSNFAKLSIIWTYDLSPLLSEYYFDNPEEVDSIKEKLFKNVQRER